MKRILAFIFSVCFFSFYSQVPAYVPTLSLTGYWPFNGNANDVSGNGNNGAVNGASLTLDRFLIPNSAYSFNGVSDYISVNSSSSLSGYTDMSISAWIQISSFPSGIQGIVTKWYQASCITSNGNSDTYEGALSGNQVQFATNNNNLTGFTSPPSLSSGLLNTWIHLAYTSSATQGLSIYINGVLSATFATTGAICTSTNTLYFGTDYHGTSQVFHRFFNGKIDDIGIWSRVLTNCEIQQLYTANIPTLSTSGSYTAVCFGSQASLIVSGASNYTWQPGGANSPSITVSPTSTTVYSITGVTANNCILTTTHTLLVNPSPSLNITTQPTSFCSGQQVTLTATGADTYNWIGIGTGSTAVATVTNPAATFTLVGFIGPCAVTSLIFYNVQVAPTLSISSSDTTICQGATASLLVAGGSTYTWQPGNFNGASLIVNPAVTTVYTVTGTNVSGCSSSKTFTIFVTPQPNIIAMASPSIICPGNQSTLTVTGATNYTWSPGGLTGSLVIVSLVGPTIYTVIADNNGCLSVATVSVNVGLDVSISTSGNLCTHPTLDLMASPALPGFNYVWTGPGIVGPTNTSSVNVAAPGIYSVFVTNALNNCSGSASISLANGPNSISLTIIPSSTVTCFPGPPVNMLVSASANLSWLPATEVIPNIGPLVSVSPSVTTSYTVLGQLGACTGSAVVTISVNNVPVVDASSSSSTVCAGKTISLTATGANDYIWLPGNLSGSSVTVSPFSTTVYTLTGANGNCTSVVKLAVEAFTVPVISTTVSPAIICKGNSATLTATGASTLVWFFNDLPVVSSSVIASPVVTTNYTLTGTNSFGCISTTIFEIQVIDSPPVFASVSSSTICAGQSVTLTAAGAATYTWLPGFIVAPSIVDTPTADLTYTLLGNNPLCSQATVSVFVNNCSNTSFGLTNAAESPELYGEGLYRITFTVTANNSSKFSLKNVTLNEDLESTFQFPVTYTVINPPVISSKNSLLVANSLFNGNSERSLTFPSTSSLSALTRDTLVYSVLINPNEYKGTLKNVVVGFATDISNNVVTDSSNNGFVFDPDNDGDPTNNNAITPIEIEFIEFFIPQGFSPDEDGINDLLVIKGMNGRNARFTIYNRWGNKVFEKEGTDLTWDGKANVSALGNGKLPPSTYYYTFEFLNKKSKALTGFIVLKY